MSTKEFLSFVCIVSIVAAIACLDYISIETKFVVVFWVNAILIIIFICSFEQPSITSTNCDDFEALINEYFKDDKDQELYRLINKEGKCFWYLSKNEIYIKIKCKDEIFFEGKKKVLFLDPKESNVLRFARLIAFINDNEISTTN